MSADTVLLDMRKSYDEKNVESLENSRNSLFHAVNELMNCYDSVFTSSFGRNEVLRTAHNIEKLIPMLDNYINDANTCGIGSSIHMKVCKKDLDWTRFLLRETYRRRSYPVSVEGRPSSLTYFSTMLELRYTFACQHILVGLGYDRSLKEDHMQSAAVRANHEIVSAYLRMSFDPDEGNSLNGTTLHAAAFSGNLLMTSEILNSGANVNALDDLHQTPLMIATLVDDAQIVEYLLSKGADPNVVNSTSHTPFHVAACRGNVGIMNALIGTNSDLSAKDNFGLSPLDIIEYNSIITRLTRRSNRSSRLQRPRIV